MFSRFVAAYECAGRPERVVAAVSGGADSVALLSLLHRLRDEKGIFVGCVHVNHGLRAASEEEERFVRDLCEKLDIPVKVYRVRIDKGNTEDKAREARYRAIEDAAAAFGSPVAVLAHHAGDQAETLMMRLMRGCGDGLGAMRPMTKRENGTVIWRPLLSELPEELRAWNTENGLEWCEDESNADESYMRNRIRHSVLPLLEQTTGNVRVNMARSAEIIRENNDFVRGEAEKFLLRHLKTIPLKSIPYSAWKELHTAVRRQVLRLLFSQPDAALPYGTDERVDRLSHGDTVNLPGDMYFERYGDRLYLTGTKSIDRPRGRLAVQEYSGDNGDGKFCQAFPAEITGDAVLRFREYGDRIRPFGCSGSKTLGDYMTDRKIPRPERDLVPLLCRGNTVLWVIGWGVSEESRIDRSENTVFLKYIPDNDREQ